MANVLSVMAVEPRHPVADVIGLEADDLAPHRRERTARAGHGRSPAGVARRFSGVSLPLTGSGKRQKCPDRGAVAGWCVDSPPWGWGSWTTSWCSTSVTRPRPWPGSYLAELGATVVRVEDRRGDVLRRRGGLWHAVHNAGKRSVAIDTTSDDDWAGVEAALGGVDVVIGPLEPNPATARFLDRVVRIGGPRIGLVDVVFRRDARPASRSPT